MPTHHFSWVPAALSLTGLSVDSGGWPGTPPSGESSEAGVRAPGRYVDVPRGSDRTPSVPATSAFCSKSTSLSQRLRKSRNGRGLPAAPHPHPARLLPFLWG